MNSLFAPIVNTDQESLIQVIRDFVADRIKPIVVELDSTGRFPEEIYLELGKMGMLGINIASEDGGAGGSCLDYCLVMEELSSGYASVADQVGLIELVGSLISKFGTSEQKIKYLPGLFSGKIKCAYGLTESNAGSDLGSLKTSATRDIDGNWILNGEKIYIHNAPVADFVMVLAKTDPNKGKRGGMTMFLVDIDQVGVARAYKEKKMGQNASPVGGFIFTDVKLTEKSVLGGEGNGFSAVLQGLEKGRVGIASLANGISKSAIDSATSHAKSREQFGQVIGQFQGVAFSLAEMVADYSAAVALTYSAARKIDSNLESGPASSIAKLVSSENAVRITSSAVQILGGAGYIRGVEVERLYRDARITTIYEGTSEVQKIVISRGLLS